MSSEFKITAGEFDGVITWSALGKLGKPHFLSELVIQHGEKLSELVAGEYRVPTVEDVDHFFGQPTECMDGFLTPHEAHDSICEFGDSDYEGCDFDPKKSFWLTMVVSEQLYVTSNATNQEEK